MGVGRRRRRRRVSRAASLRRSSRMQTESSSFARQPNQWFRRASGRVRRSERRLAYLVPDAGLGHYTVIVGSTATSRRRQFIVRRTREWPLQLKRRRTSVRLSWTPLCVPLLQNLRSGLPWLPKGVVSFDTLKVGENGLFRHFAYPDLGLAPTIVEGVPPVAKALEILYDEFTVVQKGDIVEVSDLAQARSRTICLQSQWRGLAVRQHSPWMRLHAMRGRQVVPIPRPTTRMPPQSRSTPRRPISSWPTCFRLAMSEEPSRTWPAWACPRWSHPRQRWAVHGGAYLVVSSVGALPRLVTIWSALTAL